MRVLQRVKHSVSVSLESLLDEVENHEAVAAAALRELEQGRARVIAHRRRIERELEKLRARDEQLVSEAGKWRQRAQASRLERERALECVRRLQEAEQAQTLVRGRITDKLELLNRIASDEKAIVAKLDEMRRRHSELACREVRGRVNRRIGESDAIEQVFDRWERRLLEYEPLERTAASDRFAKEFDDQESNEALEARLDALLRDVEETKQ